MLKRIGCSVTTLVFWVGFLGCTSAPTAPTASTIPIPQTRGHVTVSNVHVEPAGGGAYNIRGTVTNDGDTTFAFAPSMTAKSWCCMGGIDRNYVEDAVTDELSKPFPPGEERDFAIMGLVEHPHVLVPCTSPEHKGKTCVATAWFRLHFGDGSVYIEGDGCGDIKNYSFPDKWTRFR